MQVVEIVTLEIAMIMTLHSIGVVKEIVNRIKTGIESNDFFYKELSTKFVSAAPIGCRNALEVVVFSSGNRSILITSVYTLFPLRTEPVSFWLKQEKQL